MSKHLLFPHFTEVLVESDDVLELHEPVGSAVVDQRMATAHWLPAFIRYQWAPAGQEAYVDAYAAAARILVTAAVLGSRHPDDIGHALGLPPIFVRVVLLGFKTAGWCDTVLPELREAIADPADVVTVKSLVDDFMLEQGPDSIDWLDLLKAMGPDVLGMGKAPYGVRPVEDSQQDEQRWLNQLPPARISGPDPLKLHVVDDEEWIM